MNACGPHCGHRSDMVELAHLRALITEWVKADDDTSNPNIPLRESFPRRINAANQLRKAIQ